MPYKRLKFCVSNVSFCFYSLSKFMEIIDNCSLVGSHVGFPCFMAQFNVVCSLLCWVNLVCVSINQVKKLMS